MDGHLLGISLIVGVNVALGMILGEMLGELLGGVVGVDDNPSLVVTFWVY